MDGAAVSVFYADLLHAPPSGSPVEICMSDCNSDTPVYAPGVAYHDGRQSVYVRKPGGFPSGGELRMRSGVAAYNGVLPVTAITGDLFRIEMPYDQVREELSTTLLPETIVFGSGDDYVTIAGRETFAPDLDNTAGGFDTLEINGSLQSTIMLVPGQLDNRSLHVGYVGFDQLNLIDPTARLTLVAPVAGAPIDMTGIGIGIVAEAVTLPVGLKAESLEINIRDSFSLEHGVDVNALDLRVLGDAQNLSIASPTT